MNWWQRYRKFVQLALAVVIMITAISFINRERDQYFLPETLMRGMLGPVQGIAQRAVEGARGAVATVMEFRNLSEENQRLREELEELRFVYALLQEIRAENTRLMRLVQFQESVPEMETVAARVIAREPSNWYNTITINKGTGDGLEANMPVITHQGLVGRITSLDRGQAEVLLLLDQRSSVGGLFQNSREAGVVKGFAGETETLRMLYLSRESQVEPGDTVVTSGLGGVFPKGLKIGKVTEVKAEEYGLARYAVIEPVVDFDRLEEVLVVVSSFAESGEDSNEI